MLRWLAISAVGALVVSACGQGTTRVSAEGSEVAVVARAIQDAGSARYAGTWTGPSDSTPRSATFTGEIDFAADRSSYESRGLDDQGHLVVQHTVSVDGFAYTDRPAEGTVRDPGKPWVRTALIEPTVGLLPLSGIADVSGILDRLELAGVSGDQLGSEVVRGVETTHSRYVSAPDASPRQMRALEPPQLRSNSDFVFELWIDAQHRLRRMRSSFSLGGAEVQHDVEFFDFGVPVSIEAPPADQVTVDHSMETTGPWVLVQHGDAGDIAWRVLRAPSGDGSCLGYETDPRDPVSGGATEPGPTLMLCSSSAASPSPPGVDTSGVVMDVVASARVLANGMVLLAVSVPDGARMVLAHLDAGDVRELHPVQGVAALALGHDELVRELVVRMADRDVPCRLTDGSVDYECHDPTPPRIVGLPDGAVVDESGHGPVR